MYPLPYAVRSGEDAVGKPGGERQAGYRGSGSRTEGSFSRDGTDLHFPSLSGK